MKVRLAVCFALCGLLALPVVASPATKADFAKRYATAVNVAAADAESALAALQSRGLVGVDFSLDGHLTYGDLVDIFGRAGIDATAENPGGTVETEQVDVLMGDLATQAGSARDDDEKDPKNNGRKTRPKGQEPNSRANPNAFFGRDEG